MNLIFTTGNDLYGAIQYLPKLPKRPRTSFTSEQLQVHFRCFFSSCGKRNCNS